MPKLPHKPNFLIVGAAKAGTTSLYQYLNQHDEIFMSSVKEPLYFIVDVIKNQMDEWLKPFYNKKWYIDNYADYLMLFSKVRNEIAIGEASATYLYYYRDAIPKIKNKLGDVKIIIILRRPVDKAFSQYKYLMKGKGEKYSFEMAIEKEPERIANNFNALYHYTNQGFYFNQVKAYMENFTNVKIILTEDFYNKTQNVLIQVCKFLGVSTDFNFNTGIKYNETTLIPRSHSIAQLVNSKLGKLSKKVIEGIFSNATISYLRNLYTKFNIYSPKIDPIMKNELQNLFKDDILKLQKLINKDLSNWLS